MFCYPVNEVPNPKPPRVTHCLLIGRCPPPLGGATVLHSLMVKGLKKDPSLKISVLNLPPPMRHPHLHIPHWILTLFKAATQIRKHEVVIFNCTTKGLATFGYLLSVLCQFSNRRLILRKFAGTRISTLHPALMHFSRAAIDNASMYLSETEYLVHEAKILSATPARQLPNYRPMPTEQKTTVANPDRFVYLGRINRDKGVHNLIAAFRHGSLQSQTLDLFGPVEGAMDKDLENLPTNVKYKGTVNPEDSVKTLSNYSAMILPSSHAGEGIPGVILECLAAGIPTVATSIGGISELFRNTAGIELKSPSPNHIIEATRQLTDSPNILTEIRSRIRTTRGLYSQDHWHRLLSMWIKQDKQT
jgi:glycosyltransferase involved in cell wall biosynthesis